MVDAREGILGLEWIEGKSVRRLLPSGEEEEVAVEDDLLKEYDISTDQLLAKIGKEIAQMHKIDIIHGDLTTSNMMLQHPSSFLSQHRPAELVLIDFGLAFQSALVEDKAVDLYVLERAFASTHPGSEPLFASVLAVYEKEMGREWPAIHRRLEDVRLRGRKQSMVG